MILKRTYIILLLLLSQIAYSQDGIPVYSDYFSDNLYLLHPSMAGAASHNQVRFTARKQWFDQQNAPNLQTLSANARVTDRSGLGAIFFNDKNGYHSQTGGYLTYAHHLRFSRSDVDLNQLSFGLSLGLMQTRFDESQFDPEDFDPIIAGSNQTTSYFNVDFGISYNYLDFSGHFTVKNLLFQERSIYSAAYENDNQRKFLISAAYAIGSIGALWTYEPSFLLQLSESTGEQAVDINFKAYRRMKFGKVWGGLSIRRGLDSSEVNGQNLQYFTPVVGVNLNKFMFAYTYSAQSGDIQFQSGGFHQITIGYDFLAGRDEPYECNCPAINK